MAKWRKRNALARSAVVTTTVHHDEAEPPGCG